MKKILLLTLMTILALTASAYNFMVDGLAYNYLNGQSGNEVEVTYTNSNNSYANNYSGLTTANIPSSVTYSGKTYSVTSISNYAFDRCSGLTSVTIPNSVTSIGNFAFSGCSGLTSVTIPNSVTSIGTIAFFECSGLTSVHITDIAKWCEIAFDGTYSNPLYYAQHLYMNGSEVTKLSIPNSVTSIGSRAFAFCSGLTSVDIPNSVTSIGQEAFRQCSGLTSVTIPNSVTSICDYAFSGCRSLTSVTIPNSVTSIGEYAFLGCSSLTSVTIGNSVTSIGGHAFGGTPWFNNQPDGLVYAGLVVYKYKGTMPANTLITLRDSTKGIAGSAFYGCSGLTSVTIPNSVTSIGSRAFEGCSGLTSVTIPNSVTYIDYYAFSGCSGLMEILSKIVKVSDVSMGTEVFYNVPKSSCTLKVPIGTATAYRNANQWKDFSNINDVLLIAGDTVGDLNRDNAVNGEDINIMVNYLLHKSVYIDEDGVADIDGDGKPTGFDLNRIVRIILGE